MTDGAWCWKDILIAHSHFFGMKDITTSTFVLPYVNERADASKSADNDSAQRTSRLFSDVTFSIGYLSTHVEHFIDSTRKHYTSTILALVADKYVSQS